MKTELYRVETGILLDKKDPDFECYNKVYTKEHGFYDECVTILFDYKNAREYADTVIKESNDTTYAVITSDIFNITEEQVKEIETEGVFKGIQEFGFEKSDMIYFAYKEKKKIKIIIDEPQ